MELPVHSVAPTESTRCPPAGGRGQQSLQSKVVRGLRACSLPGCTGHLAMFAPRPRKGGGAAVPLKCRTILAERYVILVTRSRGRQGRCPYNRWMLQQLSGWIGPLVIERLT